MNNIVFRFMYAIMFAAFAVLFYFTAGEVAAKMAPATVRQLLDVLSSDDRVPVFLVSLCTAGFLSVVAAWKLSFAVAAAIGAAIDRKRAHRRVAA